MFSVIAELCAEKHYDIDVCCNALVEPLMFFLLQEIMSVLAGSSPCSTTGKIYLLFKPLGKLARRDIYFACVNFFLLFFFLSLLMIARRTIISGSTGPIFAIFSLNESVLGADD